MGLKRIAVSVGPIVFVFFFCLAGTGTAETDKTGKTGYLMGGLFSCKTSHNATLTQELLAKQDLKQLQELQSSEECFQLPTGTKVVVTGNKGAKNEMGLLPIEVELEDVKLWIIKSGVIYSKKKILAPYTSVAAKGGVEEQFLLGERLMVGDDLLAQDHEGGFAGLHQR